MFLQESVYDGFMTTTRRNPVNSIPTTIDIHQIPAVPLKAGDRIAVKLYGFRGTLSNYADNFTVGSVASYAAENGEDVTEAVERAERLGHSLYYAFNEGITITAHRQVPVERIEIQIGSIVEMDGKKFQVLESPNNNVELIPLPSV